MLEVECPLCGKAETQDLEVGDVKACLLLTLGDNHNPKVNVYLFCLFGCFFVNLTFTVSV